MVSLFLWNPLSTVAVQPKVPLVKQYVGFYASPMSPISTQVWENGTVLEWKVDAIGEGALFQFNFHPLTISRRYISTVYLSYQDKMIEIPATLEADEFKTLRSDNMLVSIMPAFPSYPTPYYTYAWREALQQLGPDVYHAFKPGLDDCEKRHTIEGRAKARAKNVTMGQCVRVLREIELGVKRPLQSKETTLRITLLPKSY